MESVRQVFSTFSQRKLPFLKDCSLFNALTKTAIELYTVTTLNLFSFNEEFLDHVTFLIQKKIRKSYSAADVTIAVLNGLPFSIPALEISVTVKGTPKYHSILLSVSHDQLSDESYETPQPVSLPLLCVFKSISQAPFVNEVHKSLENTFICSVRPVDLSSGAISWLLSICIDDTIRRRRAKSEMKLLFKLKKGQILLEVDEDTVSNLWGTFLAPGNKITYEGKDDLIFGLKEHIKNTYGLSLNDLPIHLFSLHEITLKNGKPTQIRIYSPETLFSLLTFMSSNSS